MGRGCWRLLGVVWLLRLAASQEPDGPAGRCDTIYKGFAGCLISLGESMAQNVRQQREESGQDVQELDTICKSWDDFHACANEVLSSCPEDAAAIWESLRQESRKIQFQGNLQELCSGRGSPPAQTNPATLRGWAAAPRPCPPALLLLPLLLPLLLARH
ncbi:neuritin-like protein [Colius striatus]|uniref:neuritin-like protein n=1 Tax=Colius striatus TaxID=57412 RepID=UPI002B1E16E1|nr:neuritin-like protein [Colius striatus]